MNRPKIRLTVIDRKGPVGCHRGHRVGDSFDFDTQRGDLCPMAMHVAFPYVDILRYGGSIPGEQDADSCLFCCPDPKVINVFRIERIESEEPSAEEPRKEAPSANQNSSSVKK